MGLYQPGPSPSDSGGLDRPPDDKGWFGNGMNKVGEGLTSFGKGVNRFMGGYNDWTAPVPVIRTSLTGGASQYTEQDYQNALNLYNSMTPEQRAAAGITQPPAPPENSPGVANVNLQRGYVNPLLGQLSDAAAGQGPSQAQDALREGTATSVASQYGMAATPSVGGAAGAALLANAQNNAGGAMQTGARQSAQLRAQEMTDARQQLGNVLNQQQGTNTGAMGLQLEREKANQSATMGMNTLNQKTGQENRGGVGGAIGSLFSMFSDIRAKEDIQPMDPYAGFKSTIPQDSASSLYGMPTAPSQTFMPPIEATPPPQQQAPQQQQKEGGGGLLGGLGAIFSDERSKEKIRSLEGALQQSEARNVAGITDAHVQYPQLGEGHLNLQREIPTARFADVEEPWNPRTLQAPLAAWDSPGGKPAAANFAKFGASTEVQDLATPAGSRAALGPVAPYEYRYKPEFAARTGEDTSPRAGIMAQDLEQSPNPALRSAVVDTPIGKAIDGKRAISANLALSAGLDKRLRNIEGALSQPTSYPILSDEHSKETIKVLSDALAAKPAIQPIPVATQPPIIPEGGRLITPLDESERKLRRMMSGEVDPYGRDRAAIETAAMAPQPSQLPRWARDYSDPDYQVAGQMPPPRTY